MGIAETSCAPLPGIVSTRSAGRSGGEEPREKAVPELIQGLHFVISGGKGLAEVPLLKWQPS